MLPTKTCIVFQEVWDTTNQNFSPTILRQSGGANGIETASPTLTFVPSNSFADIKAISMKLWRFFGGKTDPYLGIAQMENSFTRKNKITII